MMEGPHHGTRGRRRRCAAPSTSASTGCSSPTSRATSAEPQPRSRLPARDVARRGGRPFDRGTVAAPRDDRRMRDDAARVERAEAYYASGIGGIAVAAAACRPSILSAALLYRAIGRRCAICGGDCVMARARVGERAWPIIHRALARCALDPAAPFVPRSARRVAARAAGAARCPVVSARGDEPTRPFSRPTWGLGDRTATALSAAIGTSCRTFPMHGVGRLRVEGSARCSSSAAGSRACRRRSGSATRGFRDASSRARSPGGKVGA